MDRHVDGNIFPMQISIRFGDAVGAELCSQGVMVGNGVFLMDTNVPHAVSQCEAGVRYSIVTSIKKRRGGAGRLAHHPHLEPMGVSCTVFGVTPRLAALVLLAKYPAQGRVGFCRGLRAGGWCTGRLNRDSAATPPA